MMRSLTALGDEMNIKPEIEVLHQEMQTWRRDIHQHPELCFEEVRTADLVAARLHEFGMEVDRGLARTGVVGTIRNGDGPAIGLRADIDALPMPEHNEFEYRSSYPGRMHGCGHDGHTAMLLGAAKYLAATRRFRGTVHCIFQPAEEGGGGGDVMVKEGLFERFPVDAVYGLHNWPGMPPGQVAGWAGPMMAAADEFYLVIRGRGGHAAMPDLCVDPVVIAAEIITALQTVASRMIHPVDSVVISVTQLQAGDATNVIPDEVKLGGTVRSFREQTRVATEARILRIAEGICAAHGASCALDYRRGYPATVNHAEQTEAALRAAAAVVGEDNVLRQPQPVMGAEDFSYMLLARPGCYVWLGNGAGAGGCMLHNSRYDFNDDILPIGASYWATLVEQQLAA